MHQVSNSGNGSSAASGGHLKDSAPAEATRGWDTKMTHTACCGQSGAGVEWKEEGKKAVQDVWSELVLQFSKGANLGQMSPLQMYWGHLSSTISIPAEKHLGERFRMLCTVPLKQDIWG